MRCETEYRGTGILVNFDRLLYLRFLCLDELRSSNSIKFFLLRRLVTLTKKPAMK